jgi:hypothetical protein
MVKFEWDLRKEARNVQKHGIDFTTAKLIWNGPVFERIDDRRHYGEIRFQAFGAIQNRILTVIFTWRGTTRRIISARRANHREKRLFFEAEISNLSGPTPN